MVANLEQRLRYVEGAAAEVRGRHTELSQTTAQIRAAEFRAASDAQMMQAHAHQEALTAQHLREEMRHVQQVTDQLRGSLSHLEGQAELGESEREAVRAHRAALDQEAAQMRAGFMAREQQLVEVKRSLALGEARNAAESRELNAMLQECRALPYAIPPSPRSSAAALPPVPPVTLESHERLLRKYEDAAKEKQSLAAEVHRLSGLVDRMQEEARDTVRPLPTLGHPPAPSRSDTSGLVEDVIHRLVAMGVFIPHGEEGRMGGRPGRSRR